MVKKALFLDRDGTVNEMVKKFSKSYGKIMDDSAFNAKELKFTKGILDLVEEAKVKGYEIIIVTNQPSILKGEFTMKEYEELTSEICNYLKIKRGNIFECFHKEGMSLPCMCRKPEPGLILMAKGVFDLDIGSSIIIGDSWKDILAGQKAGIKKTIYVRRKESSLQFGNKDDEGKMNASGIVPSYIIESLSEAKDII